MTDQPLTDAPAITYNEAFRLICDLSKPQLLTMRTVCEGHCALKRNRTLTALERSGLIRRDGERWIGASRHVINALSAWKEQAVEQMRREHELETWTRMGRP